jgi:16S rRNA (guanine527-N7)-methyltransferase
LSDPTELKSSIAKHELRIGPLFVPQLAEYSRLLWEWNSRLNLTRHTNVETFVTRDLVDTLQLLPFIRNGATVVDVGSGGGIPGIALAILRPDLTVTLVDSTARKVEALRAIVEAMSLPVAVHAARAESHIADHEYDVLTARAVAVLPKLLNWFRPALRSGNIERALLIKGPRWVKEHNEAKKRRLVDGLTLSQVACWPTIGRDGESVLLQVRGKRR